MREKSVHRVALAVVLSVVLLGACSADASTRAGDADGGPTTTAAPVELPDEIPAGTTLRVGDQLDYLQTVLDLAGEDQDFPYEVEYSTFVGGPPMLQAFQGGALDTGFVGQHPADLRPGRRARTSWPSPGGRASAAPTASSPPRASTTSTGGTTWRASASPTSGAPPPRPRCSRPSTPRASTRATSPPSTCPITQIARRCRAARPTPASRSSR